MKDQATQYRDLVTDALITRIAEADDDLDNALTPIDIARARERAKFSRMDFERRRPELYGPKQETKAHVDIYCHKTVKVVDGQVVYEDAPTNRAEALEDGSP